MKLYVVQLPIGGVRYYMLHVMLRVTGTVRTLAIVGWVRYRAACH